MAISKVPTVCWTVAGSSRSRTLDLEILDKLPTSRRMRDILVLPFSNYKFITHLVLRNNDNNYYNYNDKQPRSNNFKNRFRCNSDRLQNVRVQLDLLIYLGGLIDKIQMFACPLGLSIFHHNSTRHINDIDVLAHSSVAALPL